MAWQVLYQFFVFLELWILIHKNQSLLLRRPLLCSSLTYFLVPGFFYWSFQNSFGLSTKTKNLPNHVKWKRHSLMMRLSQTCQCNLPQKTYLFKIPSELVHLVFLSSDLEVCQLLMWLSCSFLSQISSAYAPSSFIILFWAHLR